MLEIVTGVPGSGKTDLVMRRLAKDSEEGRRAVLLTTRQATHAMERRLVRDYVKDGLLRIEVMDVDRFAQRILDETGGGAGEHMSALGRMMAIRIAAAECAPNLLLYRQSMAQPGFCARLSAQLDALSRWQVSPQDLDAAAARVTDLQLRRKLSDIARIAEACAAYFEGHDCAAFDPLTLAAQRVGRLPWIGECAFYLDGLQSEDTATRALLSEVMRHCAGMLVTVPIDASHEQQSRFDAPRAAMALYEAMARECGVPVKKTALCPHDARPAALCHLRDNLFVYPGRSFSDEAPEIRLVTAQDARREADQTANEILSLCREKKLRYRDITVLCADEESGFIQMRRAFERCGISAFYDTRRGISGNAAASVLQQLVSVCRTPWRSQKLLAIYKSGLTDSFSFVDVCRLENFVLKRGIDGPARWMRPWKGEDAAAYEPMRQKIVAAFSPFFSKMEGNVCARNRVDAIFSMLDTLGVRECAERDVRRLQDAGAAQEAAIMSQVWKVICEVLGQISYVLGDETLSLFDFSATMQEGLLSTQLGLIPTTLDQVTVSTLRRWNGEGAKVVFLTGATDDALCPEGAQDALFDDADVTNLLTQAELSVARDPSLRTAEFKAQLYRALCAAQQTIIVSRPLCTMKGEPAGEAPLVGHLRRLFPHCAQEEKREFPSGAQAGFSAWTRGVRRRLDGLSAPHWIDAAGAWFKENDEWRPRAERADRTLRLLNDERLSANVASALYAAPLSMSVTQLESYAGCPFLHFAKHGLRARRREEFRAGARDKTGSLLHDMLCMLGKDILSGAVDLHEFDEAASVEWTRRAFDALEQEETGYYAWLGSTASGRAIRERLTDNVAAATRNMARSLNQSGFSLNTVEGELPPTTLERDKKTISLVGRVDRVDVAHLDGFDAARVIDYKSSQKDASIDQIYYARRLQLAAYLLAVCENPKQFGCDAITPGGMLYFTIGDRASTDEDQALMNGVINIRDEIVAAMDTMPESSGKSLLVKPVSRRVTNGCLQETQMRLLLEYDKDKMTRIAFDAAQGDARACPAWPKDEQNRACVYCDYAGACGFDERVRPLGVNRLPALNQEKALAAIQKAQSGEDESEKSTTKEATKEAEVKP